MLSRMKKGHVQSFFFIKSRFNVLNFVFNVYYIRDFEVCDEIGVLVYVVWRDALFSAFSGGLVTRVSNQSINQS